MYIAKIRIQNYRCFLDSSVDFQPGLNVIIGENNAGKTALLSALGLVFERKARNRPTIHDFNLAIPPSKSPPSIAVTVTMRSFPPEPLDDKALVATWLTKLEPPWEATLTYRFFLPEEPNEDFAAHLGEIVTQESFFDAIRTLLPKYVARILAGDASNPIQADGELLQKFDFHFLDALRDVESQMFSGSSPLLKSMLREVLDHDVRSDNAVKNRRKRVFRRVSARLHTHLKGRLSPETLFKLVSETGASDGGQPELAGETDEVDLLSHLRLFLRRSGFAIPATHNGLGYNNLIFISLILASLDFRADVSRVGQNAITFPILAIEEPEAHLHPALQYKLLKYIQSRLADPSRSRQAFLTTHSTQITAAAGLDPIICLSISGDGNSIDVAYPGRVFGDTPDGKDSRNHVDRFLDATKPNMLFSKGVVLVEGLAEQLLVPRFAEHLKKPLESYHVAIVAVDGLAFKHFLPLFGACSPELQRYAIKRRVACIIDADPSRRRKNVKNARFNSCWPRELGLDLANYEYRPISFTAENLVKQSFGQVNILVRHGTKTLEYDCALENWQSDILISDTCSHAKELREMICSPDNCDDALKAMLANAGIDTHFDSQLLATDSGKRERFACLYMLSIDGKGEHALALSAKLRNATPLSTVAVPSHIAEVIDFVCQASPT